MADCSQINNITIKGTSVVTYNSTPLPCTDVNTYDGLNTILSKFDAIICDIKVSVDSITEDVVNLTEDIMIITEDIIDINNQLETCCPTTTTTSSSSSTTTTTSSSTSTSTTTSTTIPPTTTTTTTVLICDCYTYRVTVTTEDLEASDGNLVEVTIPLTCNNIVNQKVTWGTEGTYEICVNSLSDAPFQYIIIDSVTILTEQQPINTYICCT
jgi:hypothetical protein